MTLISNKSIENIRINNKTIMQYAVEYVEIEKNDPKILRQINYVRMKKGILLPYEVVGARRRMRTHCYDNIEAMSLIRWSFYKQLDTNIDKRQKTIW